MAHKPTTLALGDFFADDSGLVYEGAAIVFAGALALVAAAYFRTKVSRTLLFCLAFNPHSSAGRDAAVESRSGAVTGSPFRFQIPLIKRS
jgi:hypothetical protein